VRSDVDQYIPSALPDSARPGQPNPAGPAGPGRCPVALRGPRKLHVGADPKIDRRRKLRGCHGSSFFWQPTRAVAASTGARNTALAAAMATQPVSAVANRAATTAVRHAAVEPSHTRLLYRCFYGQFLRHRHSTYGVLISRQRGTDYEVWSRSIGIKSRKML